jgi:hypothetical protein
MTRLRWFETQNGLRGAMNESHDATRLAIELRMRLGEITHPVDESTANELRDAVGRYAAALRTLGMKPEAAVAVKLVLREAGFEARPDAQPTDGITPEDQLVIDVVGWCIEGFEGFDGVDAERTPRPPEASNKGS